MKRLESWCVALMLTAVTSGAGAQCPDGAPPPCKGGTTSRVLRRANPALNPKAWIVVPFGNVMKAQELEWLRDASVNLLTLDMGRWTDVNVVPDKRVSDLVRELPAAKIAGALTLGDGMSIARRAGAGMLVMGDFFRLGKGARLVATVFDVRTGAKLRTVTQQTPEQDSLLTAFGPLARGVLAVPPPADAKTGEVGTQSLDAYQAYLLGVKALNRFNLADARVHLTRALALDSTFALAHLQFANLLEWSELFGNAQALAHANAARRLGAHLPRRERMLIDAGVAGAEADYVRLCSIARSLVAQDSTDIQAVFLLGECSFHDDALVRSATDSTSATFRGDWNVALEAFQRVIALDPTYLGAFEHIIDMLQRQRRSARVCGTPPGPGPCPLWTALVLRNSAGFDLVAVSPVNRTAVQRQEERWYAEKPVRANAGTADAIARQWVALDPSSDGANIALARTSLMMGNLLGADAAIKRVPLRAMAENVQALRMKLEIAGKLGHGAEARAAFDSLVKAVPEQPGVVIPRGALDAMFGRLGRLDKGLMAAAAPLGAEAVAYQKHVSRALIGVPSAGMLKDETAFAESMRDSVSCNANCRISRVAPTLIYALHVPSSSTWLPRSDSGITVAGAAIAGALAAGDTARLRRLAMAHEADAHARNAMGVIDANSVIATDAYLALGDSSSALRMARLAVDSAMVQMAINSSWVPGLVQLTSAPLWPRMMLRRADLAAAAGQRAEARIWYTKVLDLWAEADAELQPVVDRIRKSRAALGQGG